jgi:hypothetical protein
MRRQGRATQLALFAVGLVFLILYLIGAVTDVRWLMFLGFAGFLSIFAIRMLLWVDRKTPNPRRWSLYLRAFSFPVMAIGGLSETEWLLWTGAAGFGLSVVVPIGFDIAWAIQAIRTRRKVKR